MKRAVVILLALIMIFSVNVSAENTYSDVKAEMPKVASAEDGYLLSDEDGILAMLTALNLIDPLKWQGDTLNQGDFIDAVVRLKGYGVNYKVTQNSPYAFPGDDVNSAINYAYDYNIIKSLDAIKPYEPITYGDAAKILCDILGYKDYANAVGGYTRVKLYRDFLTGHSSSDNITGSDACAMLENALNTKVLDVVGISPVGSIYDERGSLSFQALGIYRVSGVVTATGISSVIGETTQNNSLNVDGINYLDEDCLYQCYTGLNVDMWVDEDGNIIYCYASDRSNDVEVIDVYNIGSFTHNQLSYYTNKGKNRGIAYSSPIIIYNGKNVSGDEYTKYKDIIFAPDDGFISVINNAAATDGTILKITSLKSMVVNAMDMENRVVYDKFDVTQRLKIDTDEDNQTLLDDENKKISFSDITSGSILTYEVSLDNEFVNAVLCGSKIEAKIDSVSDDEVVVNGQTYYLLPSAVARAAEPIKAGAEYKLYLSTSGRVFYAEKITLTDKKAYLLAYAPSSNSGFDEAVKIKIVENAEQAEMEEYPVLKLADKATIDGKVCKTKAEKMTALANFGQAEYPILYSLNSAGMVNKIDTPFYNSGVESHESLQPLSDNNISVKVMPVSSTGYYSLGAQNFARSNALILTPCSDGNVKFQSPRDTTYTLRVYSLKGKDCIFADYVIFAKDTSITQKINLTLYFVTGKSKCLENDEIYTKLTLSTGSKSADYRVHKDIESLVENIDVGDAIRCYIDQKNKLTQIEHLYDYDKKEFIGPKSTFASAGEIRRVFGTVQEFEENVMRLSVYDSYEELHIINPDDLYVVELVNGRVFVTKTNVNDIRTSEYNGSDADKIIYVSLWSQPNTTYLIR